MGFRSSVVPDDFSLFFVRGKPKNELRTWLCPRFAAPFVGLLTYQRTGPLLGQHSTSSISFVYTPRRCSWLNQVEIWFSILARRLLKRASFTSLDDLRKRVLDFISYFNDVLGKPFRWTYTGRPHQV